MNTHEDPGDTVEASQTARLIVVLMVITGLCALWFIGPVIKGIQPEEGATLAEIEYAIEKLIDLINQIFAGSILLSSLISFYFLKLAYQTHKTGRYPPPGFAVIRRITLRRGQKAKASAWLCLLFALFSWSAVLAIAYLKWIVLTVIY